MHKLSEGQYCWLFSSIFPPVVYVINSCLPCAITKPLFNIIIMPKRHLIFNLLNTISKSNCAQTTLQPYLMPPPPPWCPPKWPWLGPMLPPPPPPMSWWPAWPPPPQLPPCPRWGPCIPWPPALPPPPPYGTSYGGSLKKRIHIHWWRFTKCQNRKQLNSGIFATFHMQIL